MKDSCSDNLRFKRLVFTSDGDVVGIVVGVIGCLRPSENRKSESKAEYDSHKLDGIGVGRIRTFSFLPIPFTTPSLMIQ